MTHPHSRGYRVFGIRAELLAVGDIVVAHKRFNLFAPVGRTSISRL